jgi:hypothetical protein
MLHHSDYASEVNRDQQNVILREAKDLRLSLLFKTKLSHVAKRPPHSESSLMHDTSRV